MERLDKLLLRLGAWAMIAHVAVTTFGCTYFTKYHNFLQEQARLGVEEQSVMQDYHARQKRAFHRKLAKEAEERYAISLE